MAEQQHPVLGRGFRIGHNRQRLDVRNDGRNRVLGKLAVFCDDKSDRLPDIANKIFGDNGLGIGCKYRIGTAKRDRRYGNVDIFSVDDRLHARHLQRRRHVDVSNTPVRNGAPHNCAIPLPFMIQVVDEFTFAAKKTQIFDPFNRATDKRIGTLHSRSLPLMVQFVANLSQIGKSRVV